MQAESDVQEVCVVKKKMPDHEKGYRLDGSAMIELYSFKIYHVRCSTLFAEITLKALGI